MKGVKLPPPVIIPNFPIVNWEHPQYLSVYSVKMNNSELKGFVRKKNARRREIEDRENALDRNVKNDSARLGNALVSSACQVPLNLVLSCPAMNLDYQLFLRRC